MLNTYTVQQEISQLLAKEFNTSIRISEKRPHIFQLYLPFYHEDGDMMEIFVEKIEATNEWKISDFGMAFMRLSYRYEIDTLKKEVVLQKILSENCLTEDNGNIFLIAPAENLYQCIMQFEKGISEICNVNFL